jgi:tetratricopeptide (TPR) repeat protein
MSSKIPTIRQAAWISVIPQIILMTVLVFIFYYFQFEEYLINGVVAYLIISFLLRTQIPKSHRHGMSLVKQKQFENAIAYFEKSLEFFESNEWIDKYRFIVLLSSSKITYREMAFVNIAFCYSQIGKGEKAREYYNIALENYPDSEIAKTALNLMDSETKNKC